MNASCDIQIAARFGLAVVHALVEHMPFSGEEIIFPTLLYVYERKLPWTISKMLKSGDG